MPAFSICPPVRPIQLSTGQKPAINIESVTRSSVGEQKLELIRIFHKTATRTGRFLSLALTWQAPERQYAPIVWSLIAGWIWVLVSWRGDAVGIEFVLAAVYLSSLLATVCAIDARYGIIPDSIVVALAFGGLLHMALASPTPLSDLLQRVTEAAIFLVAAWLFREIYRQMRGYHGLGLGDVKLATAGVLWVGIEGVPGLLTIAVLSTLSGLLILKMQGQSMNSKLAIAFGPYLAIGLWLSWIMSASQNGF